MILAQTSNISTERRASSGTSSRKKSTKRSLTTTTSTEYSQENCISKYMLGLDKKCYNANTVSDGGVYADCNDNTMADYYDIMDMELANIVGIDKFADYKKNCDAYKGYALEKWLGSKEIIETSAVKGSDVCTTAMKKLTSAKKCYAAALAHDGNFFEFGDLMKTTCGEYSDVASKFTKAGDLGLANLPEMIDNYTTFQFTNKSENWRQAVEAVLAGYIYDARQACGDETYELLEFNKFTEDKRENILTISKKSFAEEASANIGNRYGENNPVVAGLASTLLSPNPAVAINVAAGIGGSVYNYNYNVKAKIGEKAKETRTFGNKTPQNANVNNVKNVYVVDMVNNISNAKSRLSNVLNTGDVGTPATQDNIDAAIIQALGGRVGSLDNSIYNTIQNLQENDAFIIKQNDGMCQILLYSTNGTLSVISPDDVKSDAILSNYTSNCSRIIN